MDKLAEVVVQPNIKDKQGEDLVNTLHKAMPDEVYRINRYKLIKSRGKYCLNDGPNGEPGHVYYSDGLPVRITHYKNDKKHDSIHNDPAEQTYKGEMLFVSTRYKNDIEWNGKNGEPCYQSWNDRGALTVIRYCENKFISQNGPNGEPAFSEWYDNGQPKTVRFQDHFKGGRNPGPNGEPAVREWNEFGQLILMEEFVNDKCIKSEKYPDLSEELREQQKQLEKQKLDMFTKKVQKHCPAIKSIEMNAE
ncbi:MAG: hypothetical protein RLP14_10335 [Owenweeksia sp.]